MFNLNTLSTAMLANILGLIGFSISSIAPAGALPEPISKADFEFKARPPAAQVILGQQLFFDKILSANNDVSCATCHSPLTGTSDGLSLGLGVGAKGFSIMRSSGHFDHVAEAAPNRVVRNSLALFNLGWKGWMIRMVDGDISIDESQPSGFASPLGIDFPMGIQNLLAAQNMMPVAQPREMAGTVINTPENPITLAAAALDTQLVWDLLTKRVQGIDEYVDQFIKIYPDVTVAEDITFVHIANSLAAYQIDEFTAINSPFDHYLKGNRGALDSKARNGMNLFYGKAQCDSCHSGPMLTDQKFYNIAMPQIGPGRQFGAGGEDYGRLRITGQHLDKYKYATPSLRNTAITGPWGHAGAYNSLEAVIRHHLSPVESLHNYDTDEAVLPDRKRWKDEDFLEHNDIAAREDRAATNQLEPIELTNKEIKELVAFLNALTDPSSLDMRDTIPMSVPSGLPLAD